MEDYSWDIECGEVYTGCSADYIPQEVMELYLELVKEEESK